MMDRETTDEIKRHFNVVAEGLRSEIRTVAEGLATNEKIDRLESHLADELNEIKAMIRLSFGELDRRMRSLEGDVASLRARLEKLEANSGS
jgi:predicted nuclease with TOPRIM domain